MNDDKIKNLIVEATKKGFNRPQKLEFLKKWFCIIDKEGQEFGFINLVGFEKQLDHAIDIFLEAEKEWQEYVLKDKTDLSFLDYFESIALLEGCKLPDNFQQKMKEEENDELK